MPTWTAAEVKKVLVAIRRTRMEPASLLALHGLRRGEIAGLRWQDVGAATITIATTRISVDGAATVSTPKTERGVRTLPLTPPLKRALAEARKARASERLQLGPAYMESGYVVVDEAGAPLHPDTLTSRWAAVIAAAGVRRIRLHDARHTCGTLLHLAGEPTAVISGWLGHSSHALTMRVYVHSQDDALRDAGETLATLMGGRSDSGVTSRRAR
jgi:integrase